MIFSRSKFQINSFNYIIIIIAWYKKKEKKNSSNFTSLEKIKIKIKKSKIFYYKKTPHLVKNTKKLENQDIKLLKKFFFFNFIRLIEKKT